jgi:hypothetical protein
MYKVKILFLLPKSRYRAKINENHKYHSLNKILCCTFCREQRIEYFTPIKLSMKMRIEGGDVLVILGSPLWVCDVHDQFVTRCHT